MTETFRSTIKAHNEPLFYNSTGSPEAYKLCIRHLSAAMSVGLAKLSNGYMLPLDALHIVDLENENILVVRDKIKLIKLEVLK